MLSEPAERSPALSALRGFLLVGVWFFIMVLEFWPTVAIPAFWATSEVPGTVTSCLYPFLWTLLAYGVAGYSTASDANKFWAALPCKMWFFCAPTTPRKWRFFVDRGFKAVLFCYFVPNLALFEDLVWSSSSNCLLANDITVWFRVELRFYVSLLNTDWVAVSDQVWPMLKLETSACRNAL